MAPASQAGSLQQGRGRAALIVSGAAFASFCANVIAGKASLLLGSAMPWHIGNVAEFALLALAVICFVVAILEKERARMSRSLESDNHREEEP